MENRIFRGGEAAVASIDVAGEISDALLGELRAIPHVLSVSELTLRAEAADATTGDVRPFPALVVREAFTRRLSPGWPSSPRTPALFRPWLRWTPRRTTSRSLRCTSTGRSRGDASCTGVVCDVAVPAFVGGRVRGHEAVQAQRVESLVHHHATTDVPPALVALLHRAGPAYARTLDEVCRTPPNLEFAGPGGLQQTVWRVPEGDALASLADELSASDLYIADGHHRVAAALEAWRRGGESEDAGVLCVIHPMDGLRLSAFHRRVIGPVDTGPLLDLLAPTFRVEPATTTLPHAAGSFGLYADGSWHAVTPFAAAPGLDVELLQTRVLDHLSQPVEIAPAKTQVDELTRRCDADGGVLFTLAPPPLETLTSLADAGDVMPPKTTYFEPKPCAGIFRRP